MKADTLDLGCASRLSVPWAPLVLARSLLAVAVASGQDAPPRAPEPSAAGAAQLRTLGSTGIRLHDPSTIVECGGQFWMFSTGRGVNSWRSKDLKDWEAGPRVFEQAPEWVAEAVPENRNMHFWAPDVIRSGERYLVYYSVSSFGRNRSVIALVSNATLEPADPKFRWKDEGIVVRSVREDDFNAIDPAVTFDAEGRLWMSFGSFWSGLKLIELDPATGQRITPDSPMHAIAYERQIEAPFIHQRDGYYYLFINHGFCCRGLNSTYNIRVGRGDHITGPYVDREGQSLMQGGGTLVLGTGGLFIGPGHAGIVEAGGQEWFGCHFYDGTHPRGASTFAIRPLDWDGEGWPVVGTITAD